LEGIKITFAGTGVQAGSGVNAFVSVGQEATYASAGTEQYPGLITECSITREDTINENRGINNLRTINSQTRVATRYPVRLSGEVDCGIPLAMAMGGIDGAADPMLHIFKGSEHVAPAKYYLPSWTVYRTYDETSDHDLNILGVTWDTGDFNIDLDGPFTFSLDGVGQGQGTTASTAQTGPATGLGSWNTVVKVLEGTAAYATSSAVTIDGLKNIGFTINNNLTIRNKWTGAQIRQAVPGNADVELRLTRGAIDDDLWIDLCTGSVHSFEVALTDSYNILDIEFDSCFSKTAAHTTTMEDQSDETVSFSVKTMTCDVTEAFDQTDTGITYLDWYD